MRRNKWRNRRSINSDGLHISGEIYLSTKKQLNSKNNIFRMMIVGAAAISSVFMAASYIDLKINYFFLFLYGVALTLISCSFGSRKNSVVTVCSLFVIADSIALLLLLKKIRFGFCYLVNEFCDKAGYNGIFSDELVNVAINHKTYILLAGVFVLTFVITGLSIACYYKTYFILMFVLTFPLFEVGAFWGFAPNYIAFFVLLICWVSVFSMQLSCWNSVYSRSDSSYRLRPNTNKFYISSKELIMYSGSVTLIIASVVSLVILAVSLFLGGFFNERPDNVNQLRKSIKKSFTEFSLKNVPDMLEDLAIEMDILPIKSIGGINGGKLGRTDKVSYSGDTALEVKVFSPTMEFSCPIYLKGYVAGNYTGNSWEQIPEKYYEDNPQLFSDYEAICYQNYNAHIAENITFQEEPLRSDIMEINIKGASKKFYYEPYYTIHDPAGQSDDYKLTEDSYLKNKNDKYRLSFYNNTTNYTSIKNVINTNSEMTPYLYQVNLIYPNDYEYRNYVKFARDKYTDVDANVISSAYDEIVKNILDYPVPDDYSCVTDGFCSIGSDYSPAIIADSIQAYFNANFKYTLTPGKTPEDKDFVKYFLEQQKQGYCTYFASAGVLLMRSFGYPARYAEGYSIDFNDFIYDSDEQCFVAVVSDKAAHAWCEVFISGLGWVPIEFTPPDLESELEAVETTTTTVTTTTVTTTTTQAQTSASSDTDPQTTSDSSGQDSSQSSENVSDHDISKGGSQNSSDDGSTIDYAKILTTALKIVIPIAIVLLILYIWHRIRLFRLERFRKQISAPDRSKAVVRIFKRYMALLRLIGIDTDKNISDLANVDDISAQCYDMNILNMSTEFRRLTEIAIEADMSNNTIKESDHEFALKELERISKVVWSRLGQLTSFYAKYIKFYY